MALLIGTDEAGYGPNLGPLVIVATVWRVPEKGVDIFDVLADLVGNKPEQIKLADSKSVYKSGSRSIEDLEKSAHVLLNAAGESIGFYSELNNKLADFDGNGKANELWKAEPDFVLPIEAGKDAVDSITGRINGRLVEHEISLKSIRTRVVFPDQFNGGVHNWGNKATLLSVETLKLIARCLSEFSIADSGENVQIESDKHGGRSKYLPLITDYLTDEYVHKTTEGLNESRYHWTKAGATHSIRFLAKGERLPTIAAASIVAKYIRQIYMKVWNGFWQSHLPHLKATAGYPVDAKRFKSEIADVQDRLGIDDDLIWRVR